MRKINAKMKPNLNLNGLLKLYNFPLPAGKTVKLILHNTTKYDMREYLCKGERQKIEAYQSEQKRHIFKDCKYVISFVPDGSTRALFVGIYRIKTHQIRDTPPEEFKRDFPEGVWTPKHFWYDMEHLDCMAELSNRLVVNWGPALRNWKQWLSENKPKEVIQIYPSIIRHDFPGFDKLIIDYRELQEIINNPTPYKKWHDALRTVFGVYLIVDRKDGKPYVGAAYGDDGILGRWREYAKNGHGGNKYLKGRDFNNFQFSILYMCSKSKSNSVSEYEKHFKNLLRSRETGLNDN